MLAFAGGLGCGVPRVAARLPPRDAAWVAVLSGELPDAIEQVARHSWLVLSVPGEPTLRRWELNGTAYATTTREPYAYRGSGDVAVHGVVRLREEEARAMAACLDREVDGYNTRHPRYSSIPGPNSNTFVAEAMRACGIRVELPATAIGRDYRGVLGAGVTESGTGVQLESPITGVRLGLREGVEAHFVALALGVHVWPPGITVPVNPGRIGVDLDGHVTEGQVRSKDDVREIIEEREWEEQRRRPRRIGAATAWLFAGFGHVARPSDAGGLAERVTVGLNGRAVLTKHHLGWGFGSDLELGMGLPAGFAWAARVYPASIGWAFGPTGYVAVFGGVGGSGVTARVPSAFEIPVEARLEVDAGANVRLGLRGGARWIPFEEQRRGGSVLGFADELVLGSFVRFGKTTRRTFGAMGHGHFVGLERHEVMGSFWLGVTVGVEIDFGG